MDPKVQEQLDELEMKVNAVYTSVEKIRKYMLITAWVTIAVIVLPLVGLVFAIPALLSTISEATALMQF
ncbi:MAG: hypothetical protein KC877_01840 [Candidatus Kaiserbacteria bacterium]|nr:hypothetical protein [Candidatus Kaiserbacteria bacterium]MCB9815908.1 hypothetical protein [Candidatus Nomurabacteria bacterium]